MGVQKNRLIETVLLNTHNMCFGEKIIFLLYALLSGGLYSYLCVEQLLSIKLLRPLIYVSDEQHKNDKPFPALDWVLKGCYFKAHRWWSHCVVSLSKTLYLLFSTGSTQEDRKPSRHD